MNKKGFTLIELLAVIVILAIIMLIATPAVLNIIEDARKGAFKNSVYGIIKAAEQEYMTSKLKLDAKSENLVFEYENGKIIGGKDLNYKGSRPESGKIMVTQDGKMGFAIKRGEWCAKKDYDSKNVILEEYDESICKMPILYGSLTDTRDSKVYKTVQIGNQTWMAENLRYIGNGCLSKTWNSDGTGPVDSCKIHNTDWGDEVLYQWGAAMDGNTTAESQGICPDGWHIPTDGEWTILTNYVGTTPGTKLKSSSLWNGTDDYGFNALPVGHRNTLGTLYDVGSSGLWWSSSRSGSNAWVRDMNSSFSNAVRVEYSQASGYSVRCLLEQ